MYTNSCRSTITDYVLREIGINEFAPKQIRQIGMITDGGRKRVRYYTIQFHYRLPGTVIRHSRFNF